MNCQYYLSDIRKNINAISQREYAIKVHALKHEKNDIWSPGAEARGE